MEYKLLISKVCGDCMKAGPYVIAVGGSNDTVDSLNFAFFLNTEYKKVLIHTCITTRWLSLEITGDRTLKLYPGLKSLFLYKGKPLECKNNYFNLL